MWNCSFVSYELSYEEERISARSNIISSLFSCLCAWEKKLSAGCLEGQSNLGDVFGAVCLQISFVADFAGNTEIYILVWCSIVQCNTTPVGYRVGKNPGTNTEACCCSC